MKISTIFFFLLSTCIVYSQQLETNKFKIGIFGGTRVKTYYNSSIGCDVPYETPTHYSSIYNEWYNTSPMNVLSKDGFNIIMTYEPTDWTRESTLTAVLKLANANDNGIPNNGLKVELGMNNYYRPLVIKGIYQGTGDNKYTNCNQIEPNSLCEFPALTTWRPNYDHYITTVYNQSPYKDIIWGYHLTEEAAFCHPKHFRSDCLGHDEFSLSQPVCGDVDGDFAYVEVPPVNVAEAIDHVNSFGLKNSLFENHKTVIMEAQHNHAVLANTVDIEGGYNPQEYLQLINSADDRHVYFEGSYCNFPASNNTWFYQSYNNIDQNGAHYLAGFKSLDYARTFTNQVHKVINIGGTLVGNDPQNTEHLYFWQNYHTDQDVPNGNWLWFQAYTSIIHGVEGIWFWGLGTSWNIGESNWEFSTDEDRFHEEKFPENYLGFTSHLAQELRFLVEKDVISTDVNTIIASKTDHADVNCIVPPASTYLNPIEHPYPELMGQHYSENYGLRYTIRSNGDDTYMIIVNPLNIVVSTTLNFSCVANLQIQNSTGVNVLFDDNQYSPSSQNYKTDRNSNIDWNAGAVGDQYYLAYSSDKELQLEFGPLDVKVLKFISYELDYDHEIQDDQTISVIPNPSVGQFEVNSETDLISNITIVDVHGKLIAKYENLNERSVHVDISNSPNGIYFMQVMKLDASTRTLKVVINH